MVDKFRRKINGWTHRWLTMGGRLILIQAVLSQMLVYWGHLYYIPDGIIKSLNRIIAKFLWGGAYRSHKIHLCKLVSLCRSKRHDGWGILNTRFFNNALLMKSFWKAVNGDGLWQDVIRCKYIRGDFLKQILCSNFPIPRNASAIWRSFRMISSHISDRLSWMFRDGGDIPFTFKKIIRLPSTESPYPMLIHCLAHKGINYIS